MDTISSSVATLLLGKSCNNACNLCNSENREGIRITSPEQASQIAKQLKKTGVGEATITGGEPTLSKMLIKTIKMLRAEGIGKIVLETNARVLSVLQNARKVIEAGVTHATITINGPEKEHNDYTKSESYAQTMQGAKNLSEAGIHVTIRILLTKTVLKELEQTIGSATTVADTVEMIYPQLAGNEHDKESAPTYTEVQSALNKTDGSDEHTEMTLRNVPYCIFPEHKEMIDNFAGKRQDTFEVIKSGAKEHTLNGIRYKITQACRLCKYNFVCPGIMQGYSRIFGTEELRSVPGKKLMPAGLKNENNEMNRLELNVGLVCNNDCRFCISGDKKRALDSFENIINEIDKYAGKDINLLNLLGGEVTLIPQLPEIISYAKQKGFEHIHIVSNGRRLSDKELLKRLLMAGLTRISVTIHGPTAELQDHIVQRKGAFDETMKGFENLKELKRELGIKTKLIIGTCVHKLNYERLEEMAELAKDAGAEEFLLININPIANCEIYPEDTLISYKKTRPYLEKVTKRANEIGLPLAFSEFPHCQIYDLTPTMEEDFSQKDNVSGFDNNGERYYFDYIEQRNSYKVKIGACDTCIFNDRCEGMWTNYVKAFGKDDFRPIKLEDLK